jgi:hypothetical protein
MIHKTVTATCLVLVLATIVVAAVSYRMEIVCWGKDRWKGAGSAPNESFVFAPGVLVTGSRAGFENGAFVHVWTFTPVQWSGITGREVNGIVFRWQRRVDAFLVTPDPRMGVGFRWPRIVTERVIVPLWGPLVLFMIYPCMAMISGPYRRYRRRRGGLCIRCGYNLTGNVSGVCPECGGRI